MNENEDLIYGKNKTYRIVCVEQHDTHLEIFREVNGKILNSFIPCNRWILSSYPLDTNWIRLKGELHYKFGKQYNSEEEFQNAKIKFKHKDIYFINNAKEAALVNKGITYYKDMKIEEVSVLSFDLETTTLNPNLPEAKVLLISTTYRKQGELVRRLFAYDEFENEGEMIEAFCEYVRSIDPSIILGHNIMSFDIPYLNTIAEKHGVSLKLGRDGSEIRIEEWESKFRKESTQFIHYNKAHIYGREIVDTLFLSIKYDTASRKYMSYGLKNIIKQEGLEKKDRTFYDAGQIRFKYQDKCEWEKIKAYCVDDSDDSITLFDLMIPAYFFMTNSIPMPFQKIIESASGSQLNSIMVRSYLQQGHSIPKATEVTYVEGGISFGVPGIYKNVIKVDLKSAYPSQILRFKLFDKEKDPQSNFYLMTKFFTEERFKLKELARNDKTGYYKARDAATKIFINSMYGLCNTPGLNFNSPEMAAKITKETRNVIELALQWASGNGVEYWRSKCEL